MRDRMTPEPRRTARWIVPMAATLLASALLLPTMAGREPHHGRGHEQEHHVKHKASGHHAHHDRHPDRHIHGHGHGPGWVRGAFVVPARLGHAALPTYRSYHQGRAYYGPHRHYHEVYHFPVRVTSGHAYRPYHYCEGDLYGGHLAYQGVGFGFEVRF